MTVWASVTRARVTLDVTMVALLNGEADQPAESPLPAFEVEADALVDGTIQPESEPVTKACPRCMRTDVYRERTGLIGVHQCEPAANADAR